MAGAELKRSRSRWASRVVIEVRRDRSTEAEHLVIADQREDATALVHDRHAVMTRYADVSVIQAIAPPRHRPILEPLRQHEQVEPGRVVLRWGDRTIRAEAARTDERSDTLRQRLGMKERHRAGEARGGGGRAAFKKLATTELTGIATNDDTRHAALSLK